MGNIGVCRNDIIGSSRVWGSEVRARGFGFQGCRAKGLDFCWFYALCVGVEV